MSARKYEYVTVLYLVGVTYINISFVCVFEIKSETNFNRSITNEPFFNARHGRLMGNSYEYPNRFLCYYGSIRYTDQFNLMKPHEKNSIEVIINMRNFVLFEFGWK